jgi:hypothetical protein
MIAAVAPSRSLGVGRMTIIWCAVCVHVPLPPVSNPMEHISLLQLIVSVCHVVDGRVERMLNLSCSALSLITIACVVTWIYFLQNANLVLTANREGRPKGKEPTGEPETLAGRKLPKMGDRAARTVPEELKKRKAKYEPCTSWMVASL